ncbi:MAG: recombinase family protein [Mycobacterium sp.]|nr:MAG: recombinase family protein [Mycobacterium sp.]
MSTTTAPAARRKAFIYLRVSRDMTGERLTVQRHEKDCRALCGQRRWDVVKVFTDNSVSAKGKAYRADFNAMLDAIRQGGVDVVVAWALDRFIRNARDRLALVEACREHGVMIALVRGGDMDPTTATGRMTIDVIGAAAQMEIDMKSERQVAAAIQRAELGRPPLGTRLTGYTSRGQTKPDEAELVRRIFKMFHSGESLRGIALTLTDEGLTARSGKAWNPSSIRETLTNPRYAGRSTYNRHKTDRLARKAKAEGKSAEPVVITQGTWEALVDEDVFDAVQSMLSDPRRRTQQGTDRKHLGSGMFLCDTCGQPVVSFSGGRYRCKAACVNRAHGPLDHARVRQIIADPEDGPEDGQEAPLARGVDEFVTAVVTERLSRRDARELLAPPTVDTAPLIAERDRLRARLTKADADYDDDLIDARRWRTKKDKITAQLAEVDREIKAATPGSGALGDVLDSPDPAEAFLAGSLMARRSVIDALCEVRLQRGTRGSKTFDPNTVRVEWRS